MLNEIIKTVYRSGLDYLKLEVLKNAGFGHGQKTEANVGNICLVWDGPLTKAKICLCERDPYGNPDVNNGEWIDISDYMPGKNKNNKNWYACLVCDISYNVAMLIDVDEDERQAMLDELEYRQQHLDEYDWGKEYGYGHD